MPSVRWNKAHAGLPPRTCAYLEHGTEEGNRNRELYAAAQQMKARGDDINAAGPILLERAMADGLSETEATETINSAWRSSISEPLSRVALKPLEQVLPKEKPVKLAPIPENVEPVELPDPVARIADAAIKQLETWFKEGEYVSISLGRDGGDRIVPDGGETRTREKWAEYLRETVNPFQGALGVFIRVNPMAPGGSKAEDVTAFRSTLVEFDNIPKEQQYALFLKSGLPIRTLIDSGGKSIHAVVAIDAQDRTQYNERVEAVRQLLSNYAPDKTIDPGRYSRLAGIYRPAYKDASAGWQQLLATNIGPRSWVEWEKAQIADVPEFNEEFESSPPIISLESFTAVRIPEPPKLIHGVLYRGGKLVFGGPPKIGKTFVLMDLAISVANGGKWLGKQCDRGRVLYVNFELDEYTYQNRWFMMKEAKKVGFDGIDLRQMKGSAADISKIVDQCVYLTRRACKQYDLVILDPIYKCYGENRDENSAGDMSEVLNELDRLIKELKTSVAFAAHFPKGNMQSRQAMDRISGSGVFARDPEAIVCCTPWDDKDQKEDAIRCDIDWTVRTFKDVPSIVVKKKFPLYEVDDAAPERSVKHKVEDILIFLQKTELKAGQWMEQAATAGIDKNEFYELQEKAVNDGLVKKPASQKGAWSITPKGAQLITPAGRSN